MLCPTRDWRIFREAICLDAGRITRAVRKRWHLVLITLREIGRFWAVLIWLKYSRVRAAERHGHSARDPGQTFMADIIIVRISPTS